MNLTNKPMKNLFKGLAIFTCCIATMCWMVFFYNLFTQETLNSTMMFIVLMEAMGASLACVLFLRTA